MTTANWGTTQKCIKPGVGLEIFFINDNKDQSFYQNDKITYKVHTSHEK